MNRWMIANGTRRTYVIAMDENGKNFSILGIRTTTNPCSHYTNWRHFLEEHVKPRKTSSNYRKTPEKPYSVSANSSSDSGTSTLSLWDTMLTVVNDTEVEARIVTSRSIGGGRRIYSACNLISGSTKYTNYTFSTSKERQQGQTKEI